MATVSSTGRCCKRAWFRLGFRPVAHTARVILLQTSERGPLTHMFLTVRFGRGDIRARSRFRWARAARSCATRGADVREGRDVHRMVDHGHEWVLEAYVNGAWTPLWSSTIEPAEPVDFVMAQSFRLHVPDVTVRHDA